MSVVIEKSHTYTETLRRVQTALVETGRFDLVCDLILNAISVLVMSLMNQEYGFSAWVLETRFIDEACEILKGDLEKVE